MPTGEGAHRSLRASVITPRLSAPSCRLEPRAPGRSASKHSLLGLGATLGKGHGGVCRLGNGLRFTGTGQRCQNGVSLRGQAPGKRPQPHKALSQAPHASRSAA